MFMSTYCTLALINMPPLHDESNYHKGYHTHKKTQTKLNGENKKHVNLKLCCRGLQPTFTSECPSDQCLKFIDDVTVSLHCM